MASKPIYTTPLGKCFCADGLELMASIPSKSVNLVMTSPPYALHFKKEYGNANQSDYVEWFLPFAREIRRVLAPDGSFVLNIGGSWTAGAPTRSLYQYRLLLALCDSLQFKLCQEFFWYNPAKLPAPAEWVNVRRVRVKDSVEYVFWLGASADVKADNRRVLQPYSKDMLRLIKRGVKKTVRPSGHNITTKFSADKGGSIPPNLLEFGNNESNSAYMRSCKAEGKKAHPARYPWELPRFFIQFLTESGDLVLDPFAGSNTTGAVAESLGRRWIAIEENRHYAADSRMRFAAHKDPAPHAKAQTKLFG